MARDGQNRTGPIYRVKRTARAPELRGEWEGSVWGQVESVEVGSFLRHSSDHRPKTTAKLLYDDAAIYGIFAVQDRYVRCRATEFQGDVWADSCVEIFIAPEGVKGYFNLEMNCGGAFLCYHMIDPTLVGEDHREYVPLKKEDGEQIRTCPTLPKVVDPELADPTDWRLEFALPFSVLRKYAGDFQSPSGRSWRANLFKCAEEVSHPHWASWSPVDDSGDDPQFHQPEYFGVLIFE